jgi:hypothetical protein
MLYILNQIQQTVKKILIRFFAKRLSKEQKFKIFETSRELKNEKVLQKIEYGS